VAIRDWLIIITFKIDFVAIIITVIRTATAFTSERAST
jgi:hypothetical protein